MGTVGGMEDYLGAVGGMKDYLGEVGGMEKYLGAVGGKGNYLGAAGAGRLPQAKLVISIWPQQPGKAEPRPSTGKPLTTDFCPLPSSPCPTLHSGL